MQKKHWLFIGFGFYALNFLLLSQNYSVWPGWFLLFDAIRNVLVGYELHAYHLQVLMPSLGCTAFGTFCLVKALNTD